MTFEPEWNIADSDDDAAMLGLRYQYIKEKIQTYIDSMGWDSFLSCLIDLVNSSDLDQKTKNNLIASYNTYQGMDNVKL